MTSPTAPGTSKAATMAVSTPPTISSLLTSLHTHLQTQTQLLPTLHAQLGLPESALTDELDTLHRLLAECVEQQIARRQSEVEQWNARCEDIERECIRYSKALGSHAKVISSSVGELRKEHVLPRRFEHLKAYRERMKQLYSSKLEQLNSLTSKVTTLARTLGSAFFAADVLAPTPASGDDPSGPLSNRDVTPERFSRIEKELVRGKTEMHRRLILLSATLLSLVDLYVELGVPFPTAGNASTSMSEDDPFLSTPVISTPTPGSRALSTSGSSGSAMIAAANAEEEAEQYVRVLEHYVSRLEEAQQSNIEPSGELFGVEGVVPTLGLLKWVETTKNSLDNLQKEREAQIQALFDQLEPLWKRLGVEETQIDQFVEQHRGSTEDIIHAYQMELEHMLDLKREKMGEFVDNARAEIESLWNDLMYGSAEREAFFAYHDDELDEALLSAHEAEIARLKGEKRSKAPLLAALKRYFDICEEEKELAASATDQTRLLGRGNRDPGRLLREEKMRKRVAKEKPRLEQELFVAIPAWEDAEAQTFLVDSIPIIDIIREAVSRADEKENRKRPRAGSVPHRATTPVGGSSVPPRKAITPSASYGRPESVLGTASKKQRVASTPRMPFGNSRVPNTAATNGSSLPRPNPPSIVKGDSAYSHLGYGPAPGKRVFSESTMSSAYGGAVRVATARSRRRESFRPRPSVDRAQAGAIASNNHRLKMGFLRAGIVTEEG